MKTISAKTVGYYVSDHRVQGRQTGQFIVTSVLRETMVATKTTHKELRERHGMYLVEIEMILRGGHVSLETALKLQSAFGSPALFWIKLDGRQQITSHSCWSQVASAA